MANRTSLDKLPNTGVFVAAEIGSIEVLELVAQFISPHDGIESSILKTGRRFP